MGQPPGKTAVITYLSARPLNRGLVQRPQSERQAAVLHTIDK